ncbi:SDR family NAD(P)-dependent oxidoreductase [Trinickia caryophylli]|uniref:NAD(P)-dependent dehydrogenase, short-chain alcohol dehydrogenase family n=1 Tax=Trinickia caryophylli TaxID=28094 RepID=A0A1X7CIX1_TRICW|nr:SDR family NAD(P)-dependent oxidoreductase [Trinickia caryophylli]PMS11495.1 3-oxoacyl-ACP reductase [Trinickia caryophylli]TRX20418.1 SDR family NAD(P)-dependent oxidoreductase [Trinickia caryophylli]WQE13603.1 SDR family NAD(P)-dependent oxidoreductase [Trinickia caryophylli]SME97589.1 NAD(P)-dependent dehydrogenase, short-chain alcohol dehydrogenase family [Trinickia caryophylli]GLU30415.1 short-chain dehydrogenase [Trinickia caryophylli]
MPHTAAPLHCPAVLLIGASRGLGHAMAAEFLKKGWHVTGTVRASGGRTLLHDLADAHPGRIDIETLDITRPEQIRALRERLAGRTFDMLFVNAGTTNPDPTQTIGEVSTDDFVDLMITNALSPMRVVERLSDLVAPAGLIGIMSSGQGSIANNESGQREVYRGSKAALNQFMRSFAAREADSTRALVLMAPGWVRTELGGPEGRLSIDESVPGVVNVLLNKLGRPGLEYLDYLGRTVPW